MKDKALKLAQQVLKSLPGFRADIDNALDAIKEALAQPAQPDTDMAYTIALQRAIEWHCKSKVVPPDVAALCPHHAEKLNKALAQPEQEPVATINDLINSKMFTLEANGYSRKDNLYTTPPQRTWVDLPHEDILDLFDEHNVYGSKWLEFARAVEAKLKEKNT